MDSTSYVSLSRAIALEREMTMIATNIANVGTSGYRAERLVFETVLERAGRGARVGFVQDRGPMRERGDAPLVQTGETYDLAITGEGFFTLRTPEGLRYTRAGHFRLDAEGRIATRDGALLLDADGAPIEVPAGVRRVSVAEDGTVSADGEPVARVQAVLVPEPALRREGVGRYATDAAPSPAAGSTLRQGAVVGSDVQPVAEMARMIETQRAFEGAVRLMETHHDLVRRTVERAGAVGA